RVSSLRRLPKTRLRRRDGFGNGCGEVRPQLRVAFAAPKKVMEPFATAAAWKGDFSLPPSFDIGAIFFFALTGVLAAVRRGYDFIGLFTMAFVTGLGGALIRDGIFLQDGPPALMRDSRYFLAVIAGCIV